MSGIERLTSNDAILIFYTDKANTMTFALHESINHSPARVEYFKVANGARNSLDFQLVSYLGYIIAKNEGEKYVIITNDEGFATTANFWVNRGIDVTISSKIETIAQQQKAAQPKPKAPPKPPKSQPKPQPKSQPKPANTAKAPLHHDPLLQLLPDYSEDLEVIKSAVDTCTSKAELHTALVKKLGAEKAPKVYKTIKSMLGKVKQ